jgi:hypothetical protein
MWSPGHNRPSPGSGFVPLFPLTAGALMLSVAPHHEHLADAVFELIHPVLSQPVRSQIDPLEYFGGRDALNAHFHHETGDQSLTFIPEGATCSQSECRRIFVNFGLKWASEAQPLRKTLPTRR